MSERGGKGQRFVQHSDRKLLLRFGDCLIFFIPHADYWPLLCSGPAASLR